MPASRLVSGSSGEVEGVDLVVAARDMKLSPLNPLLPLRPLLTLALSEREGCITSGADAAAEEKKYDDEGAGSGAGGDT